MSRLLLTFAAAAFVVTLAAPAISVATSTEAAASMHKTCVDWCTNHHGQKFRLHGR